METMTYKGYRIEAVPYRMAGSVHWRMKVHISKTVTEGRATKSFFARNMFGTRNEATDHCFDFGKEIIDGRYSKCSLEES